MEGGGGGAACEGAGGGGGRGAAAVGCGSEGVAAGAGPAGAAAACVKGVGAAGGVSSVEEASGEGSTSHGIRADKPLPASKARLHAACDRSRQHKGCCIELSGCSSSSRYLAIVSNLKMCSERHSTSYLGGAL
eukprot:686006-Pelagomonas_calceolata.AAC.2